MASGTVKWFDPNKGYGFIRPDHGKHARRADATLPPATQSWRTRPMRRTSLPPSGCGRSGQWRRFRRGDRKGAGGRDAEGRRGAAVRPGVAGLPGRPRPAPQLEGQHGVVPRLPPALAAGRGRAVPLARPGSAVGPGGQGAGRVPLPRRSPVRGAARGDRGGPSITELARVEHAVGAGSPTERDLAALQGSAGRRPRPRCDQAVRCDGPRLEPRYRQRPPQQVTWSRPMTVPSAAFQAWIASGVGSSST
jgi:'Cold-shock' DNA-binding domain